jgi:hypothetical protein
VGRECVGSVVSDVSTLPPPPTHARRADVLAAVGFGVVLVLTILPWSRFGDDSGLVGAWSLHWSLVAALTALFGFGFSLSSMRRQADPRMTAWMYPVLALVVIAGAILHRIHPPPLSAGSPVPLFALVAACLPLAAGLSRAAGTLGRR